MIVRFLLYKHCINQNNGLHGKFTCLYYYAIVKVFKASQKVVFHHHCVLDYTGIGQFCLCILLELMET